MQPNQVSVRSVSFSERFVKPSQRASNKGGAETQQEQGRPALLWAMSLGEKSCRNHILHPSTWELHPSMYTHEAAQGASALFLKHPQVLSHWGLSLTPQGLTDRRGTWHCLMVVLPHQGRQGSLAAPPQTDQLFNSSVSLLPATSAIGSRAHFDNQTQPAHYFVQNYGEMWDWDI